VFEGGRLITTALNGWESFHVIVGAAAPLPLFIGIHNAWDAVTYHVFIGSRRDG
jgi:hypothetical protein